MTEQMSDDSKNNVGGHNLNVGQKFNDYEQLSMSVNAFCRERYHPFVIRTRSQKQVLYKCCHGIKQISKCQGKRPNQKYYYKSCPAQINFYKGKNERWTLTKLLLDHNHTIGRLEYGSYGKGKKMNEIDCDSTKYENVDIKDNNIKECETFTKDFSCRTKVLPEKEKFSMALAISKNIADILSSYGTETFNKYLEELKVIESNARNGISLFEPEKSAFKPKESEEQIQTHKEPASNQSEKNLKCKTRSVLKGCPKKKIKQTTFFMKKIKIQNKK